MPKVLPFKGVRAAKDIATHLISRSYQQYNKKELKSVLKYNPFSFLHILNPGYKFNQDITGVERFQLVRNRYLEFKEEQYLITDDHPALYLYECNDGAHSYLGIIGATSTEDYDKDLIKKHEDTLQMREILFKDYLKCAGFNAEPVLITYPDQEDINRIVYEIREDQDPLYHFKTTDFKEHKVWNIQDPNLIATIQESFAQLPELYIADGHHRSASASLLHKEMGDTNERYGYFMSFLIAESQLKIDSFNRMVMDLNGLTKDQFLMQLDEHYRIQNRGLDDYSPSKKHHFSMYLDGEYYSLYLRKNKIRQEDPLSHLDTQLLYDTVLSPILGIDDPRTDNRLAYVSGKNGLLRMKEAIDHHGFAVGFGMLPATVEQIKNIADANQTMPPKSTYIQPKLPSGLIIYEYE